MKILLSKRTGQSLVEILIAVALGTIFVLAAATIIPPALRSNTEAGRIQAGIALGKELLDNARVWAERDWNSLAALATTSANQYHLTTSSSPFNVLSGEENIAIGSSTYSRYFYVDEVGRDASGSVVFPGGAVDPSTRKLTAVYSLAQGATGTISVYVTRARHKVWHFTDWSGGSGQAGPITLPNPRFATSSGIDYSTTSGSIIIKF